MYAKSEPNPVARMSKMSNTNLLLRVCIISHPHRPSVVNARSQMYLSRDSDVTGAPEVRAVKLARIKGMANAAARFGITPSANSKIAPGSVTFSRSQCVAESATRPMIPVADRRWESSNCTWRDSALVARPNVELTGPTRQDAPPARSMMSHCCVRAA